MIGKSDIHIVYCSDRIFALPSNGMTASSLISAGETSFASSPKAEIAGNPLRLKSAGKRHRLALEGQIQIFGLDVKDPLPVHPVTG